MPGRSERASGSTGVISSRSRTPVLLRRAGQRHERLRRVVAHMNPVAGDDVKNIEAAFRKWVKTLKAKEKLLP